MSIPTDHHHVPKVSNTSGGSVLTNRYLNRGTAFTMKQREDLHILARLPPTVETLEEQVERVWRQLCLYEKPINKYSHLAVVHATNTTLYYAVLLAHIEELLPVIYTPTVGEACIKFSRVFVRERGLYLNKFLKGRFEEVLRETKYHEVEIIVITDGSRILGLGDLGSNGVGISLGKCSLYIAGAGLHPMRVLPIVMDCGTNNKDFLEDKDYLGIRERRLDDEQFYGLMDEFMDATRKTWPTAVIQFEDFSNNHCFDVLERYQNKYRCFNDDIQGTGAVIAAGFLNAIKLSGLSPLQQRVVVFGAGSAAVGVARNIAQLASRIYGCSVEEVLKTFYLVDTKGLVTTTRGDTLAAHKVLFARTDVSEEDSKKLSTLEATVAFVKPTALLGLGGVGPVFTEAIVKQVAANCEHPIIFPLSNPTSKSEVNTDDAYRWTNGKAIVAAGSPYPPTVLDGKTLKPSQGNNLYVFPGVGLGCAICQPTYIPDDLLIAASASLNALSTEAQLAAGELYPPLDDIHNISANIAVDVILDAQRLGIDTNKDLPREREALLALVKSRQWIPHYPAELGIDYVV
ncbi:malate dehydrogenase (oxaloacetate-decarboxylating) [Strigomonas culicis]|uniref:Malic enzyme n=1 Tax=Strigomonas culicis TaxID=28005 RepID=S9TL97_9TRYP|nr:malate dehydrogenase (oxaloacetate-decarboxylating) [Strigomonas culicis]EPY26114.1 malate dehydrogenase (oxaloacetate-decarboxylating) [Strigomonas culicis]|eukprot:EPY18987.1 malate dehydrogenase (oxaloacetate-decarboxylating) [Strigomonas culicis]